MDFLRKLEHYAKENAIPQQVVAALQHLFNNYNTIAAARGVKSSVVQSVMCHYLDSVVQQLNDPFPFEPYHERILKPFNYYQFGLDFFRPLIDFSKSKVLGKENLKEMVSQVEDDGDNVILFANHQTEPDPQIFSLLLEKEFPKLAEDIIFVAGHRVVTDPFAIPMSLGRNLLCIYSKKYIDHPPEDKEQKQLHNHRTMKRMSQLLSEGGQYIYVAPSGGRDRPNEKGEVEIDAFDPQSIEMFALMAKQAEHPTHFYPLALSTYQLTPPPNQVRKELGEQRDLNFAPAHLAFGEEIDMDNFPGSDVKDKKLKRVHRAEYIYNLVKDDYSRF